jgi:hypothetical protein
VSPRRRPALCRERQGYLCCDLERGHVGKHEDIRRGRTWLDVKPAYERVEGPVPARFESRAKTVTQWAWNDRECAYTASLWETKTGGRYVSFLTFLGWETVAVLVDGEP